MLPKRFLALTLFAALAVMPPCMLRAQWVQTNGPYGGTINSLATNGTNLYAGASHRSSGGGLNGFYRSTNKGASWIAAGDGLMGSDVFALITVGTNVFASASEGLFRSTDNGDTWSPDTNGLPASSSVSCFAVSGPDLLAGIGNNVFLSSDGGNSWTEADNGIKGTVGAIASIGGEFLVGTIGYTGYGVFVSSDRGKSWVPEDSGLGVTPTISSLAVIDSSIFAVNNFGLFHSTNNCNTWSPAYSGMPPGTNVTVIVGSGRNLFVGTLDSGVYLSTDMGNSWNHMINELSNAQVNTMVTSGANLFAGITGGGVFISTNNGINWSPINSGIIQTVVWSLASFDSNLFVGTYGSGISFSTDNGISWIPKNVGIPTFPVTYDAFAMLGTNLFAACDANYGSTSNDYRSTNNGASWTQVDSIGGYALAVIGGDVFVAGGLGFFLSTDTGISWIHIDSGLGVNYPPAGHVFATIGNNIFAGTEEGIFRSTDNGASWKEVDSGFSYPPQVYSFAVIGTNLFVGTEGDGVVRSTDRGTSWTKTGFTAPTLSLAASGTNLFAGSGGIYVSTDSGQRWSSANQGFANSDQVQFLVVSGSDLFAGTYSSGVWRRPISEMIPPPYLLNASADTLDFGNIPIGHDSLQTLTLSNVGKSPLTIRSFQLAIIY